MDLATLYVVFSVFVLEGNITQLIFQVSKEVAGGRHTVQARILSPHSNSVQQERKERVGQTILGFFLCLESGLQHSQGPVVSSTHAQALSVGGEVCTEPAILRPDRYRTVGFSVSFPHPGKIRHRQPGFCPKDINLITSQITLYIIGSRTLDLYHVFKPTEQS